MDLWPLLTPLAGGVLYSIYKCLVRFGNWAIDRAVDQFTHNLQERWKADITSAVELAVAPILEEVSYNNGHSLKDAVRRIERSLEELHLR